MFRRVSRSNFNSSHFSFLSKDHHLQLYLLHPVKPLIVARLFVQNGDQLEEHPVRLFLHSYILYLIFSHKFF